jgi:hypothetical protein
MVFRHKFRMDEPSRALAAPMGMWIIFRVTVMWLALSACDESRVLLHNGLGGTDAATPTSLAGSAACGTGTCGSGELCVEQESGIANDAGVATTTTNCSPVGAGCIVTDCDGSGCPTCVAELCAYYPSFNAPVLRGRNLSCPGE